MSTALKPQFGTASTVLSICLLAQLITYLLRCCEAHDIRHIQFKLLFSANGSEAANLQKHIFRISAQSHLLTCGVDVSTTETQKSNRI